MQTVEVHLWDDLHHKQGDGKVPADEQVELEYRHGKHVKRVRLDLTAVHEGELAALLAPYLEAGTPPDDEEEPRAVNGGKIRRGPPGGPGGTAARRWRADLRAWSDSLGLVNREDPAFPAWKTVTDKHYYPSDLEDAYTLHLAGREDEALALVAKFKPQAEDD
jgi:hypothetical protein